MGLKTCIVHLFVKRDEQTLYTCEFELRGIDGIYSRSHGMVFFLSSVFTKLTFDWLFGNLGDPHA